jgi:hypothetical protein
VSLIHEALRKARREAARAEDPGVIYPGGLTGRQPRRSWAVGFAVGALLSIAAGVLVVGTVWWLARDREAEVPGPSQAQVNQGSVPDPSSLAIAEPSADRDPTPRQPVDDGSTAEPGTQRHQTAPPAADPESSPDLVESRATRQTVLFQTPTAAPQSALRDYVADADLGHATLSLDYIVFRPDDPFAQINGLDVRVGSTIEGCTVEEITAEAVRLRDSRGPLVLRAQ